jgi:hypothetical protein
MYTSKEGAYMTSLTINSFRVKVSKLGIKGKKEGAKVYYTHKQIEDVYDGVPAEKPTKRKVAARGGKS